MNYNDKVVLITGGGSGMGQLAARNCAAAGAKVAIFDLNAEGMEKTANGYDAIKSYKVDMTDAAAVEAAVKEVTGSLGPIDRLYNAAAIMPLGRILDQDTHIIHKLMDINYGGLVNITKAALPAMVERGSGDFISFASMAGFMPAMYVGAYNATKFAALAFTEVLYHENINSGVRFACVCPPPVATPLLQQGRDSYWPKTLDQVPPIEPQEVLDEIDKMLDKRKLMVLPGKNAKLGYYMRRWLPGVVWKNSHKIEGV